MRSKHHLRWNVGLLAGLLVLLVVPSATAQDQRQTDLSAGYLNVNQFMHGWNVQLSTDVTRHWGVFLDVDGAYGSDCGDCEEQFHDIYVLFGSRWSWRPRGRFSLFAQTAAGGLHSRSQGYTYYLGLSTGVREFVAPAYTVNYFVVQPGGGVTIMMTRRLGIRTQVDVPLAFSEGDEFWLSVFPRVAVGTVIRLGTAD